MISKIRIYNVALLHFMEIYDIFFRCAHRFLSHLKRCFHNLFRFISECFLKHPKLQYSSLDLAYVRIIFPPHAEFILP
jgi:hypothetical protein